MQQKHVEPNILGNRSYAPYECQAAGAIIIDGGAPSWITEMHYYYGVAGCRPAVQEPKELKMVLTQFKNGFHLHPNALKSVGGWGSAPDPQ